jgi:hypothetical protein
MGRIAVTQMLEDQVATRCQPALISAIALPPTRPGTERPTLEPLGGEFLNHGQV